MRCVVFAEELRTAHDGFVMLCCTVWLAGLRCSHHGLVVLCSTAWLADNCWAQIEMITIRRLWRCSPPSGSLRFDDGHDGHDSEFGCRAIELSASLHLFRRGDFPHSYTRPGFTSRNTHAQQPPSACPGERQAPAEGQSSCPPSQTMRGNVSQTPRR